MGKYGLLEDSDQDESFDIPPERPHPRKRTYPDAFAYNEQDERSRVEIHPYSNHNAVPVAIEHSEEGLMPLGLAPSSLMDCFKAALGWIRYAMVEYGSKFFNAVGSWMERNRAFHGDDRPPVSKRQRVLPRTQGRTDYQGENSERSPLLVSRPPQQRSRTPSRQARTTFQRQPPLVQEPLFKDSFLSGAPYIDSRQISLPEVPRRRHPPPSRTQRYKSLTSRLQGSQQSHSQPFVPGGAIRKPYSSRPGPYDRIKPDAESRLAALEKHAQNLQTQPISTQPQLPKYTWNDEEVKAELRGNYRRHSQKQSTPIPPTAPLPPSPQKKDSPTPFNFKFSTPIPSSFNFGGQFFSPPKSGVPEFAKTGGRSSGLDKARFTFELPPSTEKERNTPLHIPGMKDARTIADDSRKPDQVQVLSHVPLKTHKRGKSSPAAQPQQIPHGHRNELLYPETNDQNTLTILAKPEKPLIHKTLPSKSQAYTYHIDTTITTQPRSKQESQLSQSFPPHSQDLPVTPTTPNGHHRRTKSSVVTPTRSSRRSKLTNTYAEDSHREFIRDLRQLLGDKKQKREQEEREIDLQIKKLREEGKAVESTLAGEIPRLPELLARKVHEALYDTPDNAVVVENSFGTLCGRDIHRLQKGEWLNDEIINYYLSMVRERSIHPDNVTNKKRATKSSKPLPRIFAFNTFFYSLLSSRGYAGVRRWTKKAKINVFDLDRVVIPINKGGFHWILVIVNITEKRVEYYDSMGREGESKENQPVLINVRNFMMEEAKAQNQSVEEVSNWTFYVPKTPKQKNGWDCGVFTCITAERLTGEVGRMNYGQGHMDRLREYMVAEIIDGVFYH